MLPSGLVALHERPSRLLGIRRLGCHDAPVHDMSHQSSLLQEVIPTEGGFVMPGAFYKSCYKMFLLYTPAKLWLH